MSKQSLYKSMGYAGDEGGEESSSRRRKQQPPRDGDYETALRLQQKLDEEAGHSHHHRHIHKEYPTDSRKLGKAAAAPPEQAPSRNLYPKEIQAALDEVQKFTAEVMETTCRRCGTALMSDFDVRRWFRQWESTKGQPQPSSICSLTCPNKECRALTCLGCGEKPRMGKFIGEIDGFHLDWCCESGRLFAVWSLLCVFDSLELAEQDRSQRQVQQSSNLRTKEFSSNSDKGTGYGKRYEYDFLKGPQKPLRLKQGDDNDDSTKQILALIIELLPRRSDKSKAAPPVLGSMIELSLVQDRIAALLRNDSLRDTTARAGLYFTVFEFFERLGKHPNTSYLISEERFVKKHSSGLFVISTSKGKGKARASHQLIIGQGEDRTTASLLACMSKIGIQSESLLKASRAVKNEFRTAAAQDLLEVADRIAKLQLSMKLLSNQKDGSGPKKDRELTWTEYNQKYCVTREENMLRHGVYYLASEANSLSQSPPNRIKRLVTEASEMETSLPPNIFVKIDEVRPDVMKCLIIGPEGTPYEAGLFEFDIFCPVDYPLTPPKVIFCNALRSPVLFNPNLHLDGLVCLSLLGTWPGPPESKWQGARSSIFSVLVSIQAMIFCPNPAENHPEKIGPHGLARAKQYISLVQVITVRYAMLNWLQNNEMRKGLWRDVLRAYFEQNDEVILGVVSKWIDADTAGSIETGNTSYRPAELRGLRRELAEALEALKQNRRHL